MVCKNCGADLKPNTKYCLECGSYIDEDEYEDDFQDDESSEYPSRLGNPNVRKKRKKLNLTVTDYLIYGGLLLVMVVSIIVIIVALVSGNKEEVVVQPTPAEQDTVVTIENYQATIPAGLNSTVQGSYLYVSDDDTYTFSFQSTVDDFDAYLEDTSTLEKNLEDSNYEIISSTTKEQNGRDFIIFEIKVNGTAEALFLTKINSKYTGMGIIQVLNTGKWEDALPAIDKIVNSISFTASSSD